MGKKIKWVTIQCQRCAARFAPPIKITDRDALAEFARWGGIVDCVRCHHFVEISISSLHYAEDDSIGHTDTEPVPAPAGLHVFP